MLEKSRCLSNVCLNIKVIFFFKYNNLVSLRYSRRRRDIDLNAAVVFEVSGKTWGSKVDHSIEDLGLKV